MTHTPKRLDELEIEELAPQRRHLRVAVCTETYPPEVNGVARSVAALVQGLREREHAVQLLRPRQRSEGAEGLEPGSAEEVLTRGLPVPRYPQLRMGVVSQRSLVQLWSARRPDLVHIATEGPMGWSALQAARHLKLPVCSEFRTNFQAYAQHYGVGWLRRPLMAYLRKFHNRAQCTMVPNARLKEELVAQGFRQVCVLGRGVDTQLFDPARRSQALRAQWGAGPDDLVLLHVGRLAAEKNLGLLLQAFAAVRQRQPRARLVLVGDGPARAELQAQAPEAIFMGMQHGEALAACYASGDLFVFPSLTETFGNVTTEALASGLPVLAFDYAAAAQLVQDGRNGALVPFGDGPSFVQKAAQLAAQPAAWKRMGRQARQGAQTLAWSGIVQSLETIYQSVIDKHLPTPAGLPRAGLAGLVRPG